MPPDVLGPIVSNFRRQRKNFDIEIEEVFEQARNGMRMPPLVTPEITREARFQSWLLRVGGTGTRPEFYVFEELERLGLRSPYSDPPGQDFDFLRELFVGPSKATSEGFIQTDLLVFAVTPPVVIRVQGEFFHYANDDQQVDDILEKAALEGLGLRVVDILAQDTLMPGRLERVVLMALSGWQMDLEGRLQLF